MVSSSLKQMICKHFWPAFLYAATLTAAPVFAQDAADDEALTLLDQTVDVAEDGPPEAAAEPSEEDLRAELAASFERFSDLQDRGILDEAENLAKQVIELSIRVNGPRSNDTARALNNLAVVQHMSGNYEAAQQNFQSAIDIIKDNQDQLTEMLINPLKGLGAAQLAGGRPDLAWGTYREAVHVSHVNLGPHNLAQVELLEGLAESNLRLGEIEDARGVQDMIYALHLRYYEDNAIEMVQPLMRRARWQHRTGYILDERATYRRIIRIIETVNGDDDLALIEPLLALGKSYFYVDSTQVGAQQLSTSASAETFFKRAVRITDENPDASWQLQATTKLALGDYYSVRSDIARARKSYREAWDLLSTEEERLAFRHDELEGIVVLKEEPLPQYIAGAQPGDAPEEGVREGRVVVAYNISDRGRVTNLRVIETSPDEFSEMQRAVVRELRRRVYRPRFENGEPVDTTDQSYSHTFYYLQETLDELRGETVAEEG